MNQLESLTDGRADKGQRKRKLATLESSGDPSCMATRKVRVLECADVDGKTEDVLVTRQPESSGSVLPIMDEPRMTNESAKKGRAKGLNAVSSSKRLSCHKQESLVDDSTPLINHDPPCKGDFSIARTPVYPYMITAPSSDDTKKYGKYAHLLVDAYVWNRICESYDLVKPHDYVREDSDFLFTGHEQVFTRSGPRFDERFGWLLDTEFPYMLNERMEEEKDVDLEYVKTRLRDASDKGFASDARAMDKVRVLEYAFEGGYVEDFYDGWRDDPPIVKIDEMDRNDADLVKRYYQPYNDWKDISPDDRARQENWVAEHMDMKHNPVSAVTMYLLKTTHLEFQNVAYETVLFVNEKEGYDLIYRHLVKFLTRTGNMELFCNNRKVEDLHEIEVEVTIRYHDNNSETAVPPPRFKEVHWSGSHSRYPMRKVAELLTATGYEVGLSSPRNDVWFNPLVPSHGPRNHRKKDYLVLPPYGRTLVTNLCFLSHISSDDPGWEDYQTAMLDAKINFVNNRLYGRQATAIKGQ